MPEDTRSNTQLSQLIGASNPCLLTPTAFMISWNGVLVLAFDGWPEAITGESWNAWERKACIGEGRSIWGSYSFGFN